MIEPRLNYVSCPGPAAATGTAPAHRMAYWEWREWSANGAAAPAHVIVCVHGLSRQGRDFDALARTLCQQAPVRVICPDVVGRGHSDWLQDPMQYQIPVYAADMLALLAQVQQQGAIAQLDWVGTSMGGLIGLALAGQAPLPVPLRRLVLNDVGPSISWAALQRIGQHLGQPVQFASQQQGADALWAISASFGPHTRQQWLDLSLPMLRPGAQGGWVLHYDPALAQAFAALTEDMALAGEQLLWQLYSQVNAQTLLLRGADSDLLSAATAQRMTETGPRAQLVEFAGVGHAPTLVAQEQQQVVADFLLNQE